MDATASEENTLLSQPEEVHCSLLCRLLLEMLRFYARTRGEIVSIKRSE